MPIADIPKLPNLPLQHRLLDHNPKVVTRKVPGVDEAVVPRTVAVAASRRGARELPQALARVKRSLVFPNDHRQAAEVPEAAMLHVKANGAAMVEDLGDEASV